MKEYPCFYAAVLAICSTLSACEIYHLVTPTSSARDGCCLTLDQVASNSSEYIDFNTTLMLASGTHILTLKLEVANKSSIVIVSLNSTAQVVCENSSSFLFHNVWSIYIENVELIGCGENQFSSVNELTLRYVRFEGQQSSGTALEVIDTDVAIINCTFFMNTRGSFRNLEDQFELFRRILGTHVLANNLSYAWIGGAVIANNSYMTINSSIFEQNQAFAGGAIFLQNTSLTVSNTSFIENQGPSQTPSIAAVLYQENSQVILHNCLFSRNSATIGGSVFALGGELTAYNSNFSSNFATYGGALFAAFSHVILQSQFTHNEAEFGGVIRFFATTAMLNLCEFHSNGANFGGAMLSFNSSITVCGGTFVKNNASVAGAVAVAAASTLTYYDSVSVNTNTADEFGVMYYSECNVHFLGNTTFSNNFGTLLAIYSNITFSGLNLFQNNLQPLTTTSESVNFQGGGAVSLFQSNALFDGVCIFECNQAANGGALYSSESKLDLSGNVTVTYSRASGDGGAIYLSQSELTCFQNSVLNLVGNVATRRGGAIHARSSIVRSISTEDISIGFYNNSAEEGGGLYLETNAKLYIHKRNPTYTGDKAVHFVDNCADYGAAIYVDDDTNSATCEFKNNECFFRVVYNSYIIVAPNLATISFRQNFASVAGSTLFGGLLDRCIVSPFARLNIYALDAYTRDTDGASYFKHVSTGINSSSISSLPARVCLCYNNRPNCSYQKVHKNVKKGETFSIQVSAVDQIGHPVGGTIQSILKFNKSGLAEGQLTRTIPAQCTELTFNIVSPQKEEVLSLYASNGPCNNAEFSTLSLNVDFLTCTCPIGFQPFKDNIGTNCTCVCDDSISSFMTCDPLTESLMKRSQSNVWISYINNSGYLVYPHCPYGYCNSQSITVNLNQPDGEDAQCAFNRSGLLCGSCQSGFSLSLGSLRCVECPNHWPVVFVFVTLAALLAGVVLVAVVLVLNLTVAVGTLNGLIFYVNVVSVNRNILLPFKEQNFITVFISWLNLELGIDTCYVPGMDAYSKTWIQLGFVAAYVVFLIAFIIVVVSSYSSKFTNIIGKRNPVATLSTLVFFSYAKLLEIVFTALSFNVLQYPDGSRRYVWLPDATVSYLQGKHIVLFITALLLLLIGLLYTILLFSWQWLLRLSSWKMFSWTRNQKLHTFIETYHAPYIHKHRYWTGMLLLVRVLLYFTAAVNDSNNPQVTLVSVLFVLCFILMLKGFIGRLYKKWPVDILETFLYFNLATLSLFAWHFLNRNMEYEIFAYISITITLILLFLIIAYHIYKYTMLFAVIMKFRRWIKVKSFSSDRKLEQKAYSPPPDDILDMVDRPSSTSYKRVSQENKPAEISAPTCSVLELNIENSNTTITTTTSTVSISMGEGTISENA